VTVSKPICSLSLDLDNQWAYMKGHGDPGWELFPSYLDLVVPRVLNILDDFSWKITVFVVGQDAALERNREAIQTITAAGHEIGNHSFNHEPWLHLYTTQQVEEEIVRAEDAIEAVTGQRPRGFRGPGYSYSQSVLEVLADRGYLYDASTFPTFLGPLARAYYLLTSDLDDEEKDRHKQLFGGFRDGCQPVKPYLWALGDRTLLEIPVTTMPILRMPVHFSYLLFVSTFSHYLARLYFLSAMKICRIAKVHPSLLLHPLDFLGREDDSTLEFFPAMTCSASQKKKWLMWCLETVAATHTVTSVGSHAVEHLDQSSLRVVCPDQRGKRHRKGATDL
jgi:hypothetical protein